MSTNSKQLREETKYLHDRTEELFRSQGLFDGTFSLDDYTRLLKVSLLYIQTIYPFVVRFWPDFAAILRVKRDTIFRDFVGLGEESLPKWEFEVSNENQDYALGLVYVIIGSMLGNAIIYKYIHKLPAFDGISFDYLTLHQGETSHLWKDFVQKVDDLDQGQFHDLLQGAKSGYELLIQQGVKSRI